MSRESDIQDILSGLRTLSGLSFDAESVAGVPCLLAGRGLYGAELTEAADEVVRGCRHAPDLWDWLWRNGAYGDI